MQPDKVTPYLNDERPTSLSLKRLGEYLYRHHADAYYALVKVGGKQIKRSLRTSDLSLAKRREADFVRVPVD